MTQVTLVIHSMIESIILYLQSLPPEGILLAAFIITFSENIFPPAPSDVLLVFCGTLVGIGTVGFIPLAVSATIGSTAGFAVMYWVGIKFGVTIESGKWKFMPVSAIRKSEEWFKKYGYWLIIANRFLSGTRAVISVFAGMSRLNFPKTLGLSAVSALVWNCILCYGGLSLGNNWRQIDYYLTTYSQAITPIIIVVVLVLIGLW
ncbi:MAG: DedA family protein [Ignavibacteria bacterium]|nr:DedA family protein [Ignavibacteria bacterium]